MDYLWKHLNTPLQALCSIQSQHMNVFKQPTMSKSPYKPLLVATFSSISTYLHTAHNLVLDTTHPGIDDNTGRISQAQFYVPYTAAESETIYIRGIRPTESLCMYTCNMSMDKEVELEQFFETCRKQPLFNAGLPICSATVVANMISETMISPLFNYKDDLHFTQLLPSADNWTEAYKLDEHIQFIMKLLQPKAEFSKKDLRSLPATYRPLRESRTKLLNGRIVFLTPIGSVSRFLTLIVIPEQLRKRIFYTYHATPMRAHMGRYKTLLVIQLRFFWTGMRKDMFTWVAGCVGYNPAKSRIRESAGLVQSWPFTPPFAIISVDLWAPGDIEDYRECNHLVNCMCYMTQFVVSIAT